MSNICHQYDTSHSYSRTFWQSFGQLYVSIHEYDTGIVITFGLVSNILMLIVLSGKKMSNPSNAFLIGISIADMVTLSTYFCIWLPLVMFKKYSYEHSFWYIQLFPSYSTFKSVSTWLTVFLGVWRVITIYCPFITIIKPDMKSAKLLIVSCFAVMPLTHITHFRSYKVGHVQCNQTNGGFKDYFYVGINLISFFLILVNLILLKLNCYFSLVTDQKNH